MNRPTIPALRWLPGLAVVLSLALIGPASPAEEEEQDTSREAPAAEQGEVAPAPELRIEQGRLMTNRGGAATAPGPQRTKAKLELRDGMVITNDVLERLVGPAPDATAGEAATEPPPEQSAAPDPLKVMQNEMAMEGQRRRMISEAEREVEAAKTKLANLEVQLLAARNPFSKRPQLSDEEKERRRTSGETAAERYERTQRLVDEARAEVAAAEEKLAQLRSGS
jgi:hypothetical protein